LGAVSESVGKLRREQQVDREVAAGFTVVAAALGVLTYLVLWSRRTIERIARKGLGSAREILKDRNRER